VQVHYRGTLIDGTEFDSSYSRGEPVTFGLSQVIPGWTEGLQLMSVGSKYKLYVPSSSATAAPVPANTIGPNAALVFEVELLGYPQPEQLPRRRGERGLIRSVNREPPLPPFYGAACGRAAQQLVERQRRQQP
jgi:hypothetical protein